MKASSLSSSAAAATSNPAHTATPSPEMCIFQPVYWIWHLTASRLLCSVCVLVSFAHAQPPIPARGWNDYQVIMWSTGAPGNYPQWLSRLREIGATAEESGAGNNADVY